MSQTKAITIVVLNYADMILWLLFNITVKLKIIKMFKMVGRHLGKNRKWSLPRLHMKGIFNLYSVPFCVLKAGYWLPRK